MEVVSSNTLLPGDPRLIDHIVCELKSQGIFDQFRRECIADVDTKPAYQNLRQRVEGSVSGFLKTQRWRPDMNKNQLREMLRKNIYESGFLETGVERIVDQVVNPKINAVFLPQVEDVVYQFLGLEKPAHILSRSNGPLSINTDLLPTDLDPISPDSEVLDKSLNKSDKSGDVEKLDDSKADDFESPPFEPITEQSVFLPQDESSNDSHLSGISGLTSNSNMSDGPKEASAPEITNQDSQLSKVSSNSRLSIITNDDKQSEKMDISDDTQTSKLSKHETSSSAENGFAFNLNELKTDESSKTTENTDDGKVDENEAKTKDDRKERSRRDDRRSSKHDKDKKSDKRDRNYSSSSSKDKDKHRDRKDSKSSVSKDKKDPKKDSKSDRSKSSSSKYRESSSKSDRKDVRDKHKTDKKPSDPKKPEAKSRSDDKSRSRSESKSSRDRKSSSGRDKDRKDPKKPTKKDDHSGLKDKKTDGRRSTDRDSNDGSSGNASATNKDSSDKSKSLESSDNSQNSGDSNQSTNEVQDAEPRCADEPDADGEPKMRKPRFASNFFEAKRLMKVRKKMIKLERKRLMKIESQANAQETPPEENQTEDKPEPEPEEIPKNSVISKASWDEIEAKLNQNMININYDSYIDENADSSSSKSPDVKKSDEEDCLYFDPQMSATTERYLKQMADLQRQGPGLNESLIAPDADRTSRRSRKPNLKYCSNDYTSDIEPEDGSTPDIEPEKRARKRKYDEVDGIDADNNNKKVLATYEDLNELKRQSASGGDVEAKIKTRKKRVDFTPVPSPEIEEAKEFRSTRAGGQRYSSDDLYKPRPFVSGTRRTRGSNADKEVVTKRRR